MRATKFVGTYYQVYVLLQDLDSISTSKCGVLKKTDVITAPYEICLNGCRYDSGLLGKRRERELKRRNQKEVESSRTSIAWTDSVHAGNTWGNNGRASSLYDNPGSTVSKISAHNLPKVMNIDSPCGKKTNSSLHAIGTLIRYGFWFEKKRAKADNPTVVTNTTSKVIPTPSFRSR
jgi:hypothetical protein